MVVVGVAHSDWSVKRHQRSRCTRKGSIRPPRIWPNTSYRVKLCSSTSYSEPFVRSERKRLGLVYVREEMGQILVFRRIKQYLLLRRMRTSCVKCIHLWVARRHEHPLVEDWAKRTTRWGSRSTFAVAEGRNARSAVPVQRLQLIPTTTPPLKI